MSSGHQLLDPVLQAGFAGLCVILIGLIAWLVRQLVNVLKENNRVISANTQAMTTLVAGQTRVEASVEALRDEMVRKPCLARGAPANG